MALFPTILLEYGSISYDSPGIWLHFIQFYWNMALFQTVQLKYGSISTKSTGTWLHMVSTIPFWLG